MPTDNGKDEGRYDIQLAPLHGGLEHIRIDAAKRSSDHPWFNRTLCKVNDALVRIGVFQGEFHWHSHDDEDEFFYVVDGVLEIEVEGRDSIRLEANEGCMIPRGVRHRPVATSGATVLMVERDSIVPTGS